MKLNSEEKRFFLECLDDIMQTKEAQEMKNYIQHSTISTFLHCTTVAYYSYWVCQRMHLNVDKKSLIRGAFLHDFYLYDWHDKESHDRGHGWKHPGIAVYNAKILFDLGVVEENIIASHMWPLTLRTLPKSREAVIVCILDKVCSTAEICRRGTKTHSYDVG